jgi:hypothetical protein
MYLRLGEGGEKLDLPLVMMAIGIGSAVLCESGWWTQKECVA